MSQIIWAKTVRCDWRDCLTTTDVSSDDRFGGTRELPPGWVDLRPFAVRDSYGTIVAEICPTHGLSSIAELAALLLAGVADPR